MPSVLVVNHHSLMPKGCVAQNFGVARRLMSSFFKTWQCAVDKKICEKYIACDTDIWNWTLCASKTMHDYVSTLDRDSSLLVHNLLKITKRATTEYFGEDILDIVTSRKVYIDQVDVPLIGCVCLSDNAILLSLRTGKIWESNIVYVCWEPVDGEKKSPPSTGMNFSEAAHVEQYCATLETQYPITKEKFKMLLPSVVITPRFWSWFEVLKHEIQLFIVKKAQFCAGTQWTVREKTPFAPLRNTRNTLSELRCWPVGKTLRIYTKRKSSEQVVFLGGSDKDGQDEGITQADAYYEECFSSADLSRVKK